MKHGFQIRHFLIVEDDANDAALIRRTFNLLSPRCTSFICRNTSEARAYLKGAGMYADRLAYPEPDAVISDVRMPGGTGIDFVAWIRSEEAFHETPVVILTGSASEAEMEAAGSVGAQMVLRKPGNPAELKALLQKVTSTLCNSPIPASAARL